MIYETVKVTIVITAESKEDIVLLDGLKEAKIVPGYHGEFLKSLTLIKAE